MKKKIDTYSFDASAQQITLTDYTTVRLDSILLITNVTDNLIIYNFADPTAGGTVSGNIITLDYNTTAMDDADKLQIFYEDASAEQSVSLDDLLVTLRDILLELASPAVVDMTLNRLRATTLIESGTVTTVTTVTTVGNQTNMDTYQGKLIPIGIDEIAWNQLCRTKIT